MPLIAQKLKQFKAIIFDLDGVLWYSENAHANAYKKTFLEVGISSFEYPPFAGMRTRDCIAQVLAHHHKQVDAAEIERLVGLKQSLARAELQIAKPIAENCIEILTQLSHTHTLALASSSSQANGALFFEATSTRNLFKVVVGGDDVKNAKPSPEIYIDVLNKLKMNANECAVIEDSSAGIHAAKAANIYTIGITSSLSAEKLTLAGADAIIETISDLS